jgi:hypothetical protein
MGMEDVPFYKRLLDDLAKPRPDLSYKFKSASAANVQPGSPAAAEAAAAPAASENPVDISYTDKLNLPGRPTHPFEVRIMQDVAGNPTHIRCYKGLIFDPTSGDSSNFFKGLLTQELRKQRRVTLKGNRGNVSGDQRDFQPSNYDSSGPEREKYLDYEDPIQTTWLPHYQGIGSGGGISTGGDPEPIQTVASFATGSAKIGKDGFEAGDSGAYFEWPYSNGAMVRLFCKSLSDPEGRKWGIWGNSGSPSDLGDDGFFIFIAQVNGTEVTQMFKSDIVAIGGGGAGTHPFKLRKNMTTENPDTTVWEIVPGTVNNVVPSNMSDTFYLYDGEKVWLRVEHDASTNVFPHAAVIMNTVAGDPDPANTAQYGHVLLAKRNGAVVEQYITGSLWTDRIRVGDADTAFYYFARV